MLSVNQCQFWCFLTRTEVCGHHLQNHSLFGDMSYLCLSSVPVVTFIWAKAGEIDSHWFMPPNWTDGDR